MSGDHPVTQILGSSIEESRTVAEEMEGCLTFQISTWTDGEILSTILVEKVVERSVTRKDVGQ